MGESAEARLEALRTLPSRLRWQAMSRPLRLYDLCRLLVETCGYVTARVESLLQPSTLTPVIYTRSRSCVTCLETFASRAGADYRMELLKGDAMPRLLRPQPACLAAVVEWKCSDEHLALTVCLDKGQPDSEELAALRRVLALTCEAESPADLTTWVAFTQWMTHGLLLIREGTLTFANQRLAQFLGYASPQALLMACPRVTDLLMPDELPLWEHFSTLLAREPTAGLERSFRYRRADGTPFPVRMRCSAHPEGQGLLVCTVLPDVSETHQALDLALLSRTVLALSRVRTLDELLVEMIHQVRLIVPASAANIFLYQGDRLILAAREGYEALPLGLETSWTLKDTESWPTFRYMRQTREPLLIEDTARSEWWLTLPGTEALRSYLGVPLVVRGEVIGFLNLDGLRPHQFSALHLQQMRLFADYAAAMLGQLRLVETLAAERNRFELLYRVALSLSGSLDVETVGTQALEFLQEAFGALNVIIYLWDLALPGLRPLCGYSKAHTMELDNIVPVFQQTRCGLATWVFETGQPALVADVASNPHWVYVPGVDDWVRAALDVPLIAHGQTIGVLSLLAEQVGAFNEDDLHLLEIISIPMALALQNALFYQQTEQRAQAMKAALDQKEELERVKQQVIQNVAHELRTPVAIIMGYSDELLERTFGDLTPEQERVLSIISRRARMLNELVESMTLLWQSEERALAAVTANFEVVDLARLAREVGQDFAAEAQKAGLQLFSQVPSWPLLVRGNPLLLRRMLDNLLTNAFKFTPAGRHVTLALAREGEQQVRLTVTDEGIGIPPDKLEQVFERFYRVGDERLKRKGLGLGLALVKTIVEAHGGQVRAISPVTPGAEYPGTCMEVLLPLSEQDHHEAQPQSET